MDTRVLKEPRGFMRCLEWLFAIIAFATCVNFATTSEYTVTCTDNRTISVSHPISYPFQIDHVQPVNLSCSANQSDFVKAYPPGDYSSDAQFFVFTGVLSFFVTMGCLVVYVFFSNLYSDEQKKFPTIDFCLTVIVAVFWLSASAAWANGILNLKQTADPAYWIFRNTQLNNTICSKTSQDTYINAAVKVCTVQFPGRFAEANVSVIIGFLNFFLWTVNLWFLYKETTWFISRSGQPQGGEQLSS